MSVILVTGGTGTLGREVVARLLEDEHEVRVLSRRSRDEGERLPVRWFTGDLKSGRGLGPSMAGVDVVVHCATTAGRSDITATRRVIGAAREAGTPHLVYISIVGIDRVPTFPYYRAKLECERLVEESGLPWTILRATQFHNLITRLVHAQRLLPAVFTLGGGARLQPVEAAEVGRRLAELATSEPAGRVADMAGPEIRSAEELTREAVRAEGLHRPVLPLRLPAKSFRAVREGALLAPEHADGRVSFEEFLARH
ncbi:NAD-dependent epimerase/dehydratase family protein [Streptomyces sp. 8K308]|uniref:SDR family oxidoreductase n=1 Tax=Streptomyces sp. 8K308 TaxID=2530388 RepID=UPI00104CA11E|nr:NAD(P)H-binding protein [Streptomyces sp. 8K308]TDC27841.1 NAD-dependent epimerase/dehydratase family protein [Streptomyces sp. 8K308]